MDAKKEAYQQIRSALGNRPFLIMDTETTGLKNPELVSIAVVDQTGKAVINEFVKPAIPIEPQASRLTGITNESVANKPEFPAIYECVYTTLKDRTVVIYNADYDLNVLGNICRRYNVEMPRFTPWCAMKWFALLYGEWDDVHDNYKWQRLSVAAGYFGISQTHAHNALSDCLTTLAIVKRALNRR